MGIEAKKVFLPTPDQSSATGAVSVAPTGTDLPTTASEKLGAGWESGGYVGDAGISISTNKGTTVIKDWSQSTVRKALSDFDGTITVPFLQVDEFAAKRLVGEQNTQLIKATAEHGEMLIIDLGADMPDIESYVFSMKDGSSRIRVIVPCGQIVSIDAVNFVPNAANSWPGTLACYPGPDGWAIRIIYEDGTILDADAGGVTEKSIDDMTLDELHAFAAANNIDLGTATLKADVLQAIKDALAAPGDELGGDPIE